MIRRFISKSVRQILKQQRMILNIAEKSSTSNTSIKNGNAHQQWQNINNESIFSPENVSFGKMTKFEIMRAIVVLRICSLPGFADNATQILKSTRRLLGKTIFSQIMRRTVYGQFVSGVTPEEIRSLTDKLAQDNLLPMLACAIEDEVEDSDLSKHELFDHNTEKVLTCIDIADHTRHPNKRCMMQLKLTAIIDFETLKQLSEIIQENLLSVTDIANWISNGCKQNELPINIKLPEEVIEHFSLGMQRLQRIVTYAKAKEVTILVDAEYTWINPALQYINIALMRTCNKKQPVVFMTYQAYLKETRDLIQAHANDCKENDVHFAFKLVRGAYLLPETNQAGRHPPQLCNDWEATNKNYDSCVRDIFKLDRETTHAVFATHNENSIRLAADLLKQRHEQSSEDKQVTNISFAQLYGMADYMSFTLGRMGYNVYKSLPYGTIEETLPYLCRRAKENTLFLKGVRKDMIMLRRGLAAKIRA